MRNYLKTMRQSVLLKRTAVEREHIAQLKKYPGMGSGIDEAYAGWYDDLDLHFTRMILSSSFAMSVATFEIIFKKVCKFSAWKYRQTVELDAEVGGIYKYRKILASMQIDLSDMKDLWTKLTNYYNLRNAQLHGNSIFNSSTHKHLVEFCRNCDGIKIRKKKGENLYSFVITNEIFIKEFIDCASAYLLGTLLKLPPGRRKDLPTIQNKPKQEILN